MLRLRCNVNRSNGLQHGLPHLQWLRSPHVLQHRPQGQQTRDPPGRRNPTTTAGEPGADWTPGAGSWCQEGPARDVRSTPDQAQLRGEDRGAAGQEVRHGAEHQDGADEADVGAPTAAGKESAAAPGCRTHVQVSSEVQ